MCSESRRKVCFWVTGGGSSLSWQTSELLASAVHAAGHCQTHVNLERVQQAEAVPQPTRTHSNRITMADFNLQEEVIALQDEASYHIANDMVDGADAGEVRAILDGEFIQNTLNP